LRPCEGRLRLPLPCRVCLYLARDINLTRAKPILDLTAIVLLCFLKGGET